MQYEVKAVQFNLVLGLLLACFGCTSIEEKAQRTIEATTDSREVIKIEPPGRTDTLDLLETNNGHVGTAQSNAPVVEVKREYRFADRKMFEINRYVRGAKHGIQLLYDLNTSVRPKYSSFYDRGKFIWGMYPSADVDYTLEHGTFLKGQALGVDSTIIRAPFDSTTIWYEGVFVRVDGRPMPVDLHRIFNENGTLRLEVEYDQLKHSESVGRKRPINIRRIVPE